MALLVAGGLVLRLAAARGDLWFDEVWSVVHVREITGALGVFTAIHHDNNHYLNSLWLWLLGDGAPVLVQRLLAVATGTAAVGLTWLVGRRYGTAAGLIATALAAVAHPFVLYASEARGYAVALCAAIAAFGCAEAWFRRRGVGALVGFWAATAFGLLGHLTFVEVWVAFGLWSVQRLWVARARPREVLLDGVAPHVVPAAVLAALWTVDAAQMRGGGGPLNAVSDVLRGTFAAALAWPDVEPARTVATVLAVLVAAVGVVRLRARGAAEWVFYPCVLLLAPALMVAVRGGPHLFFRYFLVCFPFFYLLVGVVAAEAWQAGGGRRAAAAAALVILFGPHFRETGRLLAVGRGRYCDAVRHLAASSAAATATVGSDHDFRNRLLVEHYARCAPPGKSVTYATLATGPDWMIVHAADPTFDPPPVQNTRRGYRYEFVRSWPFAGVSGWSWHLYRRAAS